ncbi:hypothetical protein PMI02_04139 [Novosphingobium sp. AP12]|nr:hypothetical protein PMI02_04139 [Novosphingobium sp. AP12]
MKGFEALVLYEARGVFAPGDLVDMLRSVFDVPVLKDGFAGHLGYRGATRQAGFVPVERHYPISTDRIAATAGLGERSLLKRPKLSISPGPFHANSS